MNEQVDGQMDDGWMDELVYGHTEWNYELVDGQINGMLQINDWTDEYRCNWVMGRVLDEQMGKYRKRQKNRKTDTE